MFFDAEELPSSIRALPPDALESACALPAFAGVTAIDSASEVVSAASAGAANGKLMAAAMTQARARRNWFTQSPSHGERKTVISIHFDGTVGQIKPLSLR